MKPLLGTGKILDDRFDPDQARQNRRARSGSKQFDILTLLLK